jgi:YD repeat-containing protein
MDRRVLETYPDGYARAFSYNGVGDVVSRTDQNDIVTIYQYDDLHRLTNRAYSDLGPNGDVFGYDLSGRMTSAYSTASGFGDTFAYDGADRLIINRSIKYFTRGTA